MQLMTCMKHLNHRRTSDFCHDEDGYDFDRYVLNSSCVLCRWAENDKARLSALEAMNTMIEKKLEEISEMTATPSSQLKFLSDAWAQVRACSWSWSVPQARPVTTHDAS